MSDVLLHGKRGPSETSGNDNIKLADHEDPIGTKILELSRRCDAAVYGGPAD